MTKYTDDGFHADIAPRLIEPMTGNFIPDDASPNGPGDAITGDRGGLLHPLAPTRTIHIS